MPGHLDTDCTHFPLCPLNLSFHAPSIMVFISAMSSTGAALEILVIQVYFLCHSSESDLVVAVFLKFGYAGNIQPMW